MGAVWGGGVGLGGWCSLGGDGAVQWEEEGSVQGVLSGGGAVQGGAVMGFAVGGGLLSRGDNVYRRRLSITGSDILTPPVKTMTDRQV